MSLRRMLSEAFSGGRGGNPTGGIGALLDELKGLVGGSRRAAGRAAGIGESTLRGWDKGSRPRSPAAAVRKLATGIRKLWRTDPPATVRVTIGNPGRGPAGRKVPVDPKAMQRAGDAWERGDEATMVREFLRGITNDWYRDELKWPDDDEDSQETPDIEQSNPYVGAVSW